MRNRDLAANRTLSLDGEWAFYPGTFLMGKSADPIDSETDSRYIQVPGSWNELMHAQTGATYGYGSYRLLLRVTHEKFQSYGIRIPSIRASSEVYVNGRLLAKSGNPDSNAAAYEPGNYPYSVSFAPDGDEIEIVIQAANYDDPDSGGIFRSLRFGTDAAVERESWVSISMQLMVIAILAVLFLLSVILYLIGMRHQTIVWFALLIVSAMMTILVAHDKLLFVWLPINYDWTKKLQYLTYDAAAIFLLEFVRHSLPEYGKSKVIRGYTLTLSALVLYSLFLPVSDRSSLDMFLAKVRLFLYIIPFLTVPALLLRTTLKREADAIFLLLGSIALTSNIAWSFLWDYGGFYPFDILAAFFVFVTYWLKRYFRISAQTRQLAEKLQKEDKLKDDFLANTSHELRNPLHSILNIAQTVMESGKHALDSKNVQNMELLMAVGRRMSLLLNDLLDVASLKENRIRLRPSSLRIQSVASGVFDMLHFMTEGKRIRFWNRIPDAFPPVLADEQRLVQILFNLLHNAVKFTHEGIVAVNAEVKSGKARILIEDTGVGMDDETRRRIFHPYEQAESGVTAMEGGLGLGLSICKQLVELHGGTLEVESVPGQGSVFSFTLDIVDPLSSQEIAATESDPVWEMPIREMAGSEGNVTASIVENAAGRRRIMLIDDDSVNVKVMGNLLTMEGYDIVTASSGTEALSLLERENEWDLIISDVMMPQMSGYELTRCIRDRYSLSELPILLLTARSRPEDIETAFLSGANDYVAKPTDAKELLSRVRGLTELTVSARERLRMESAWLQAQIQPHFLFNTLNSVAALGETDTDRMHKLLVVLGDYLRSSFDSHNMERLVPLGHELNIVRSYLYIEKERFQDRLNVVWEADERLEHLMLPPLTIQPLVENAVRHGIMKRSNGGTIRIQVIGYEDSAEIVISDNGVGMNEEKLRSLFVSHPVGKSGIGLLNTNRRLKQLYG
ncbi:MAG: response regulator, partial [Cohnella sp.]|nr:response regulator [Cohnella sp.]